MDDLDSLPPEQMREMLRQINKLHYLADDDPGGPPYCPECQAYDGTGSPCATRRILDGETHAFGSRGLRQDPNR